MDRVVRVGGPARVASASTQANQRELMELRAQVEELHNHSTTIEKESQFYFAKVCPPLSRSRVGTNAPFDRQLRDVEIIIQERLAMPDSDVTKNERDTLLKIQTILYSTEVCKPYDSSKPKLNIGRGSGGL